MTKVNRSGADKDCLEDLVMGEIYFCRLGIIYLCHNLGIHGLEKHWVSEDCLEQARVKLGEAFREERRYDTNLETFDFVVTYAVHFVVSPRSSDIAYLFRIMSLKRISMNNQFV